LHASGLCILVPEAEADGHEAARRNEMFVSVDPDTPSGVRLADFIRCMRTIQDINSSGWVLWTRSAQFDV
jgi:hypothetical protein